MRRRRNASLKDIVRSKIRELGGDPNEAAARVLFEMVTDEDRFEEQQVPGQDDTTTAGNTFEALTVSEEITSEEQEDGMHEGLTDHESQNPEKWVFCMRKTVAGQTVSSDNTKNGRTSMHTFPISTDCVYLANYNMQSSFVGATLVKPSQSQTVSEVFEGGVLDTGAQRSVIGRLQADEYSKHYRFQALLTPRKARFKFIDQTCPSLGVMTLFFPTPGGLRKLEAHVSNADIPLLIGLDIPDRYGWNVLTVQNQLQSVTENWVMDFVRQDGHVYAPWDETFEMLFSREQLTNLHLHFMHPSTDKLYNCLKKAYPDTISKETKDIFVEHLTLSPCMSNLLVSSTVPR